jgi:hypothetical protein
MAGIKVDLAVKLKKDEKGPEKKEPENASPKKSEAEKFDLITIVDSVEMQIPEKSPQYDEILYDFIPETEQRVMADRDDHASPKAP